MSRYSKSRRDFLKLAGNGVFSALGIAMMPFPKGLFSSAVAQAGTQGKRQHLINLVDLGGWDSYWWYNFFDPTLNSVLDTPPGNIAHLNKIRYAAGASTPFSGQKLAPGMKFFNQTDLSRLLIWKGAEVVCGHNQNNFFYGGGESPYNASYSSLLSAYQADSHGQSVLHYVKLSSNIQDFYVLQGSMTGVAVPTCMPNQSTWSSLTSAGKNPSMQTSTGVDNAISKLAAASDARLDRLSSTGIVNGFASGFSSANFLSTSNYATTDAFLNMWLRYFQAMKQEAVDQCNSGLGSTAMGGSFQSEIAATFAALVAFPISTTADLFTSSSDVQVNAARATAWNFAMSAFLVINDLSAVVDLKPSGGDNHTLITNDYFGRVFGMTGFRELARHLSTVPNPEGGTMLDCTLITYCSEFDRNPVFTTDNGMWGTGHGTSFSALMAGHLTNGGRIIGSCKLGDASSVPAELNGTTGTVPADPNTGAVGGNTILNPKSLLPTVMQMFGAPVPPQQLTEYLTIPVLIKS